MAATGVGSAVKEGEETRDRSSMGDVTPGGSGGVELAPVPTTEVGGGGGGAAVEEGEIRAESPGKPHSSSGSSPQALSGGGGSRGLTTREMPNGVEAEGKGRSEEGSGAQGIWRDGGSSKSQGSLQQLFLDHNSVSMDLINNVAVTNEDARSRQRMLAFAARKVQIILVQILIHLPKMHSLKRLATNMLRLLNFALLFMMLLTLGNPLMGG